MSNYYREKRRMYEWAEKQVNAVHNSKQEASKIINHVLEKDKNREVCSKD